MSVNDFLKKAYSKITDHTGRRFRHKSNEIREYLASFPEPENDLQRSFFQYKCQKWDSKGKAGILLGNIVSFFLLVPKYVQFRLKKVKNVEEYDAVLIFDFLKRLLPDCFHGSSVVASFDDGMLSKEDARFMLRIIKAHPFSFLFNYKTMCRIASYSLAIKKYNPKYVFSSAEYSYTSSILTMFCEQKGIQHLNVMHGEKEYNPREAFSRFTKFYIWDEYYKELFFALRADATCYVVSPMKVPDIKPKNEKTRCTYYLQLHTDEQLIKIKDLLDQTKLDYQVRPHPVYSSENVSDIFGVEHTESNAKDIWESIRDGGYIISQDSTVLFQAYLIGAQIVLDDLSDPVYFNGLSDKGYIMMHKPHMLLSELIEQKSNNISMEQSK